MVQRPDEDGEPRDERPGSAPDGRPEDGAPDDFDARWAAIVAELGESPSVRPPEDVTAGGVDDEPADGRHGPRVVRPAGEERVLTGRDWAGSDQYAAAEEAVDEQEHFVPPDPGPVLGADPLRVLTWLVAVGVPVLWIVMLVAWRGAPAWLGSVTGVAFVAAVAVLVWRMPRGHDGDGDSGAVV